MLSVDGAHVVNVGESVSFDCQFHADRSYNLFDYPVLWRKAQLTNVADINNSHGLETANDNGILQVNTFLPLDAHRSLPRDGRGKGACGTENEQNFLLLTEMKL